MSEAHTPDPAGKPAQTPSHSPDTPTRLTAINFFPAFTPPSSGGEMRYWHLHSRLANLGFDITMVNATFPFVEPEEIRHKPNLREFRMPKGMVHHRLHQVFKHLLRQGECSAPVTAIAIGLGRHRLLIQKARECIRESKIVVFEYPFPLRPFLRGMRGHKPLIVYDLHNVEGLLQKKMLQGPQGKIVAGYIAHHEKIMCRRANVILACSAEDADHVARLYDVDPTKIYIAPNGVDLSGFPVGMHEDEATVRAARKQLGLDENRNVAIFLGSHHPPNIEAARFIIDQVASRVPDVQFLIAGSVCKSLDGNIPTNVRIFGKFDEAEKKDLFLAASMAVNPIFSGSGTNLKMLEFFGAGLPVVATPTGARGLGAREGIDLIIADADSFADKVAQLAAQPGLQSRIARQALLLAEEKFDWDIIAHDVADIFHHKTHRRVLVLNEYPVHPVNFGGRVRMFEIYKRLGCEANMTILTQTQNASYERRTLAPGVVEINVPETRLKLLGRKFLAFVLQAGADDLAAYLTAPFSRNLRDAFARERRFARAIVLSQPYLVSLLPKADSMPVIYESHDVAQDLKRKLYGAGKWANWALRLVRRCEKQAVMRACAIGVCSEDDAGKFRNLYANELKQRCAGMDFRQGGEVGKLFLLKNGVDTSIHFPLSAPERQSLKQMIGFGQAPLAVFLGSGHPPNVEAAEFIIGELAPSLRQVLFVLVGSVCWQVQFRARGQNVLLLFEISERQKNILLNAADIALNPLVSGSGTSIKVLDYLAAGATVVATPIGARGMDIVNGENGLIAEKDKMSHALSQLLHDMEKCRVMGEQGRELAQRFYDWNATSAELIERIKLLLNQIH